MAVFHQGIHDNILAIDCNIGYGLEKNLSGDNSVVMKYPIISCEKEKIAVFHQGIYDKISHPSSNEV